MAATPQPLDDILAALAEYVGDDKTKATEVARALHKNEATQPIAQVLISRGSGKKIEQTAAKVAELENKITDLSETIAERDQELETLKTAAPDWKRKLDDQDARHARKLGEVQAALDAEKKGRRDDQIAIHRQRFHSKLQPGILVDKDYADVLMTKHQDRLKLNDEAKLEVLELGSDTAYDAADGQDPIDLLVQDVLRTVPAKFKLAGEPRPGSGVGGGGSGDLHPKTFEQIREQQKRSGLYAF
jgi:hypothetical protein